MNSFRVFYWKSPTKGYQEAPGLLDAGKGVNWDKAGRENRRIMTNKAVSKVEIWKSNCVLKWRRHLTNMKMNRKMNWKMHQKCLIEERRKARRLQRQRERQFPHRWHFSPSPYPQEWIFKVEIQFESEIMRRTKQIVQHCPCLPFFLICSKLESVGSYITFFFIKLMIIKSSNVGHGNVKSLFKISSGNDGKIPLS